jgi:hypothetical protein
MHVATFVDLLTGVTLSVWTRAQAWMPLAVAALAGVLLGVALAHVERWWLVTVPVCVLVTVLLVEVGLRAAAEWDVVICVSGAALTVILSIIGGAAVRAVATSRSRRYQRGLPHGA